jgi:hypothetical protein
MLFTACGPCHRKPSNTFVPGMCEAVHGDVKRSDIAVAITRSAVVVGVVIATIALRDPVGRRRRR